MKISSALIIVLSVSLVCPVVYGGFKKHAMSTLEYSTPAGNGAADTEGEGGGSSDTDTSPQQVTNPEESQ